MNSKEHNKDKYFSIADGRMETDKIVKIRRVKAGNTLPSTTDDN